MRKFNDIMAILAVSVCSFAVAITTLNGNLFFAGINLFFAILNGLNIYSRLTSYRETLENEGETNGF